MGGTCACLRQRLWLPRELAAEFVMLTTSPLSSTQSVSADTVLKANNTIQNIMKIGLIIEEEYSRNMTRVILPQGQKVITELCVASFIPVFAGSARR